jgi:UDP-glucose 4-epimerase
LTSGLLCVFLKSGVKRVDQAGFLNRNPGVSANMQSPLRRRILVTGGAGFIGSHIVDRLCAAGHVVGVLDDLSTGFLENVPPEVCLYEVDLKHRAKVEEVLQEFRPDTICHHAAQVSVSRSVKAPVWDAETNILGWLHLLEEACNVGVRRVVLAASGGTVYGETEVPATEDWAPSPTSPYGIAKRVGERYLEFFSRERGLEGVVLRYSNVYGPRQNPHGEAGVVAIFCQHLLLGEPARLNDEGRCERDFVFVGDVTRANLLALQAPLEQRFVILNVGTGRSTSIRELERKVRDILSKITHRHFPEPVKGPRREGDLLRSVLNADRARQILGWQPEVSLEQGLRDTVQWFYDRAVQVSSPDTPRPQPTVLEPDCA